MIDQFNFLNVVFTKDEVEVTVKEMSPDKAPGLDGATVGFYQKNWEVLGLDIVKRVLNVLNNRASFFCY